MLFLNQFSIFFLSLSFFQSMSLQSVLLKSCCCLNHVDCKNCWGCVFQLWCCQETESSTKPRTLNQCDLKSHLKQSMTCELYMQQQLHAVPPLLYGTLLGLHPCISIQNSNFSEVSKGLIPACFSPLESCLHTQTRQKINTFLIQIKKMSKLNETFDFYQAKI